MTYPDKDRWFSDDEKSYVDFVIGAACADRGHFQ